MFFVVTSKSHCMCRRHTDRQADRQAGVKVSLNPFHCLLFHSCHCSLSCLPALSSVLLPIISSIFLTVNPRSSSGSLPGNDNLNFIPNCLPTAVLSALHTASAEPAWTEMTFKTSAAYRLPPPPEPQNLPSLLGFLTHSCRMQSPGIKDVKYLSWV